MLPTWATVLIIIAVVLLVLFGVLLFVGSRMQKRANAQQEQLEAAAQTVSMLIIDKKKLKLSEANLPKIVTESIPKYAKRTKFPIVKARIVGGGSKPTNLIADAKVFDILPVGKECKVVVSGIYITDIKSVRGGAIPQPPKKKGFMAKLQAKATKQLDESRKAAKEEKEKNKKKK